MRQILDRVMGGGGGNQMKYRDKNPVHLLAKVLLS
jgi:hypothetical protein